VVRFELACWPATAYTRRMKNHIGWTTCPSIGGKYAVAELLDGGVVGNGIISFATKAQAQEFIDSGRADELGSRGSVPKSRE